jgi:16S rRNA (guanine966-N2)-methyltransferase
MMKQGLVRIIAGKWRGRRLKVPDVKDLRPTPDRVRETLFNWLASMVPGAYCLDLFAGSGVLGFEALSRGAAHVVMVDQSAAVVALLKEEAKVLEAENIEIYRGNMPKQLHPVTHPFDIVFLDPPYQENLLLPCCEYLEKHGYLASSAYIYLEAQQVIKDNELPKNWRIIKSGKAGQVFYHLAQRSVDCIPHFVL